MGTRIREAEGVNITQARRATAPTEAAASTAEPFERRLGALLGTFVGDALGMPFEGAPPNAARMPLELVEARLGRGTYTDDTAMTIAVAEVLERAGEMDEELLARRFLATFDPARGYGAGTIRVLDHWRRGEPVLQAAVGVFAGGSYGNGAAMRVAPVGAHFASDDQRLLAEAARSARVTHAHPLGIAGARFGARSIPDRWLEGLEDGERGRTYVIELAERLWGDGGDEGYTLT